MGRNNEIGFNGDMPWHLPEDLKHFKTVTMGHPVIMGRNTWDSLPKRPLPGRLNIIVSRSLPESASDRIVFTDSLEKAFSLCPDDSSPFVIGGGRIYSLCMPLIDRLFVTRIDECFPQADTFFPEIAPEEWELVEKSSEMVSATGLKYHFETYERRNNKQV